MRPQSAGPDVAPCEPDIDEIGVDRAQIRQMLDLTAAERMLVIENLADSIAEIRRLNGPSAAPELSLGEGLSVRVIDLPTLIDLKEKAGRPKDLAALPVLRATLAEVLRRS
jgi:hypothetical protein